MKKNKVELLTFIPVGRENGISNKELAFRLGVTPREARRIVHRACCAGVPICGDEFGYYFPGSLYEARRSERIRLARTRSSRAASVGIRCYIAAAEAAANGQMTVEDYLTQEKTANSAANTDDGTGNY